ncbi:FadR family transcriptional regulator [Acetobacteraceae bacterium H6797]|nr:FadR family transcriptional regulator [Acetobacteraceae bacterium H6797]
MTTPQNNISGRDSRMIARLRPPTLVDSVHEQLLAGIMGGEFPADTRLPSEHDLAARFDVSRPIVRAALERLRKAGLIQSRQGAGSFVKAVVERRALGFAPVETIADIQRCYEFRIELEPGAASLAARRRNPAAIEAIETALGLLADATDRQKHREDADFAFHLAVAEASNNHYFSASMAALKDHIAVGMKLHGLSLLGPAPALRGVYEEHAAICAAIKGGDAATAEKLMREHLVGSRDRLFEGRLLDLSL